MQLEEVIIVCSMFYAFYRLVELYARRTERKMLIEKIEKITDVDPNRVIGTYVGGGQTTPGSFWALRLGLLFMGIGLGTLVALLIINLCTNNAFSVGEKYSYRFVEVCFSSCVCLFGGLALFVAYLIERRELKKMMDKD